MIDEYLKQAMAFIDNFPPTYYILEDNCPPDQFFRVPETTGLPSVIVLHPGSLERLKSTGLKMIPISDYPKEEMIEKLREGIVKEIKEGIGSWDQKV